jgi:hypothetical protein
MLLAKIGLLAGIAGEVGEEQGVVTGERLVAVR